MKKAKIPRLAIYWKEYNVLKNHLDDLHSKYKIQPGVYGPLRVIIALLYSTGLRLSEVLSMRYADIAQFAAGGTEVVVDCTKTHSTRQLLNVPSLSSIVAEALAKVDVNSTFAADPQRGFLTSTGTALTFRRAEKHMFKLMYFLELTMRGRVENPQKLRYNSHSFRVGFITRMSRHLPVTDVSFVVGHTNVQTTMVYLRTERDMKRFNTLLQHADV